MDKQMQCQKFQFFHFPFFWMESCSWHIWRCWVHDSPRRGLSALFGRLDRCRLSQWKVLGRCSILICTKLISPFEHISPAVFFSKWGFLTYFKSKQFQSSTWKAPSFDHFDWDNCCPIPISPEERLVEFFQHQSSGICVWSEVRLSCWWNHRSLACFASTSFRCWICGWRNRMSRPWCFFTTPQGWDGSRWEGEEAMLAMLSLQGWFVEHLRLSAVAWWGWTPGLMKWTGWDSKEERQRPSRPWCSMKTWQPAQGMKQSEPIVALRRQIISNNHCCWCWHVMILLHFTLHFDYWPLSNLNRLGFVEGSQSNWPQWMPGQCVKPCRL